MSKHRLLATILSVVAGLSVLFCPSRVRAGVWVEKGKSEYQIVIAADASASTRYAAEELQRFFEQSTQAKLPIVDDTAPQRDKEILIGDSTRLKQLEIKVDFDRLGEEGYVLKTAGERLVIAGSGVRGNLYGVYEVLENQLGCRWFTPTIQTIPKVERLMLPELNVERIPALEYREVMLFDTWDADWMARNRINTTQKLQPKHGGAVQFVKGFYVHTFKDLVPADKYFATHPEYFSEVDGKRTTDQLCPTNEAVHQIVIAEVKKAIANHPEGRVISVSQNDNKVYCQCAKCAEIDAAEGSHAGQVLFLVNIVAEAIAKDHPNHAVETLAYEWSRTPPKNMKPRDNVIIRLSTIRASFSEPLETQPRGRAFSRDLEGWGKICKRVWIWDYTTYFSYYLLPFPNYRVLDDNIQYFIKNNVRGIVEQNNWQSPGSELAGLKGYLLARFLWDPQYGEAKATTEFLTGVYGPAAPHIQAYLDVLASKVADERIPMPIYGSRTPAYLTLDVLKTCDAHYDRAVAAVAESPELLARVEQARLSHDYAYIEHFRWKPQGMVTYEGDPRRGKVIGIDPAYKARIDRFLAVSKRAGITHIREGEPDYADYVKWLEGLSKAPAMPANKEPLTKEFVP